jgi:hypothetical protein
MLLAALFHLWAFKISEYRKLDQTPTSVFSSFKHMLNVTDVWEDTLHSFGSLKIIPKIKYLPNGRKRAVTTDERAPLVINQAL